ncbi:hypothetical protein V8G54_027668 [Vigna mungo]|uniref:BHLH domain-containing protein n=1 Tax=Vigna mungo TaxID=3915 RepID=A0AAQ3RNA0_VIGMU
MLMVSNLRNSRANDEQQPSRNQPSSEKVERKIVERNRRNKMKNLYSQLNSLLPSHNSKEGIPLRAQIGEAIKYIKSLETKVKMAQEKKERLLEKKRTLSGCSSNASEAKGSLNPPKIEVRETDSAIQVILICGIDKNFIFCEILRILCELNVEVVNIYSTMKGDSAMHDVHCKVGQFQFAAGKVSEMLKWIVNVSFGDDVKIDPELSDYGIGTTDNTWVLPDPTLDIGLPPYPW